MGSPMRHNPFCWDLLGPLMVPHWSGFHSSVWVQPLPKEGSQRPRGRWQWAVCPASPLLTQIQRNLKTDI